jgi:hypothetical protein
MPLRIGKEGGREDESGKEERQIGNTVEGCREIVQYLKGTVSVY